MAAEGDSQIHDYLKLVLSYTNMQTKLSFFKFYLMLKFLQLLTGQKDCDLPKSYSYNQLPNTGSDQGGGRLNISSGICEPHNLHQDQVHFTPFNICSSLYLQTDPIINSSSRSWFQLYL